MNEPLVDKMMTWANSRQNTSKVARMRELALALDDAIQHLYDENGVKRMLGAWARARMYWCEVTGEPLI
jgi:hypothetical protein